jgi:hypothetical protein
MTCYPVKVMVSEAASGKRRGRPPKYSKKLYQDTEAFLGVYGPGPRTVRGQQDRIYAALAIILIRKRFPEPTEERRWLFYEAARTAKWSLLAALGRVLVQDGTIPFWQATEAVKRERPKVKVAIRRIRDWQHRNRTARSSQD